MAEYGAEFHNAAGLVQMNSSEFNFALRSKGTLSGWVPDPAWGSGTATYKTYLTVQGGAPIIALHGDEYASVQSATFDGTDWVFYIIAPYTVTSTTIEWFCFDLAANVTTTDDYGIELRNASNQVTFRIGQNPIRGIEFISLPNPSSVPGSDYDAYETVAVPSGRKYAIFQCGLFQMHEVLWVNAAEEFGFANYRISDVIQAGKVSTTTATFNILWLYVHYEIMVDTTISSRDMSGSLQWMLIDVTNF